MDVKHAKVGSRCIIMELPQELLEPGAPAERALVFELIIECPDCGQHTVRIAGHHLRTINVLVAEAVEQWPELCGNESGRRLNEKIKFSGRTPSDPSVN